MQIGVGTGSYSTQVSGSDVIVNVGTGSILLQGAASLGSSLNIAGTDNTEDTTPPDTTPANPLLITLSEGPDTYANSLAGATIAALGGNDSIYSDGSNVTILGGRGNDAVSLSSGAASSFIQYTVGDGDDTIWGSDTTSTLEILSDSGYSSINNQDDILIRVGEGSIRLVGARNRPPHIVLGASGTSGGNGGSSGGNQVISNYQSGDKIIFGAQYTGAFYDGAGNFIAGSSTGALAIQNATDKVIDLSDAAGNDFVKAYAATTAGLIDGRGIVGFELINGSAFVLSDGSAYRYNHAAKTWQTV